ncbi:MAG: NYN domain-containing protein [Candidatus Paceibacterota bacterium]
MQKEKGKKNKEINYAYIDGANLYKGIFDLGWKLDYARFRIWLTEKYNVKMAYIFIGLIPSYKDLYKYLQESGFILVYKEVIYDNNGKPKGNCDADLVLQIVIDTYEEKFNKAIIISSDGDYASLVNFLKSKQKIKVILSPANKNKCSILLKRTNVAISYLSEQQSILEIQKEKAPDGDKTP